MYLPLKNVFCRFFLDENNFLTFFFQIFLRNKPLSRGIYTIAQIGSAGTILENMHR
jgi:hypothetical protein